MFAYHTKFHTVLVCLCLLGVMPSTEALEGKGFLKQKGEPEGFIKQYESDRAPAPREKGAYKQPPPQERERYQPPRHRPAERIPAPVDRPAQREPRRERERYRPAERLPAPGDKPARRDRYERERERYQPPPHRPIKSIPERPDRPVRRIPRSSHDRHYERYSGRLRSPYHYRRHETYRYHTHYLAPIKFHYHKPGYRLRLLPRGYVRIVVLGLPYFYIGGVYYRHHVDGYIVVRAPIGAVVSVLPPGFISFSIGGIFYYYVNDTYYTWDPDRIAYVVVEKPHGADRAMAAATEGRLFVYPNQGQSEEQQANDRYECHRWAVHETGVDPSLEEMEEIHPDDRQDYRRAISACLEGRGYTVK